MSAQKIEKPQYEGSYSISDREPSFLGEGHSRAGLEKPSLLLHSCCGPCSTAVIETLAPDFAITVFFYNPNITEREEYEKRRASQISLIRQLNEDPDFLYPLGYQEGPYDRHRFFEAAAGMSNEPEGGRRCQNCFRLRLETTAQTAKIMGYDLFATTLSVSSHKDSEVINEIGKKMASTYGIGFVDRNFKKGGGTQRSMVLSRQYGLYRQNYCGCIYSKPKEPSQNESE